MTGTTGSPGLTHVKRSALAPKQLSPPLTFGIFGGYLSGQDSRRAPRLLVVRHEARDADTERRLGEAGWLLVVVWEHEDP